MALRQHKLILLRMSFSKKLQHVQRLVPTAEFSDQLERLDGLLVRAAADLVVGHGRFTQLAAALVSMPAALGGLGIESASEHAGCAGWTGHRER